MATNKEPKFTKEQLMKCKQFRDRQDLVSAVLTDGVEYTHSKTEELIKEFLDRKVN